MYANHYPLIADLQHLPGQSHSVRILNARVRSTLEQAAYVRDQRNGTLCVSRDKYVNLGSHAGFTIHAQLAWQWDVEHHDDRWWLAILPKRKFMSARPLVDF